jgi:hypothetical protein
MTSKAAPGETFTDRCDFTSSDLQPDLKSGNTWPGVETLKDRPKRTVTGEDHISFLRAIWAASLSPRPLLRYADWLALVGLMEAAKHYVQKAADVANGRLAPEYPNRSEWIDENMD